MRHGNSWMEKSRGLKRCSKGRRPIREAPAGQVLRPCHDRWAKNSGAQFAECQRDGRNDASKRRTLLIDCRFTDSCLLLIPYFFRLSEKRQYLHCNCSHFIATSARLNVYGEPVSKSAHPISGGSPEHSRFGSYSIADYIVKEGSSTHMQLLSLA